MQWLTWFINTGEDLLKTCQSAPTLHTTHLFLSSLLSLPSLSYIRTDVIKFQIRFCGPILWNCIHQFHPTLIVGSLAPTISLGSHQNIGLHNGARANVVLLTYLSHSWQSFKKHYKSELLAKYEVI